MYDLLTVQLPQRHVALESHLPATPDSQTVSASIFARMLDVVDYGLLLVLDDSHVIYANQVAQTELDETHPLQLLGKELRVRRPQDVAPLRTAMASACRKGLQRLLTLGDDGTGTVTVSIVPMADKATGAEPAALLVFGKRKVCEDLSAEAFARHHKLTAAEVRVLKQLCAGRKPSEIARAQGVALSTVRTQIGCAREKTGAQDIGALVRQVAKLPPMLSVLRLPPEKMDCAR